LAAANIRVELDDRTESVGRKIRDAEVRKVPFMLVVGDREEQSGEVGVREHHAGDTGAVAFDDFLARISDLVATRALSFGHSLT
jgi:threonyl-tRNA synthetase